MSDGRPRVGLVLGAGGVAGHAFHAGVLRALHEATGWDPRRADVIVGTSAGSLVGLGLRSGLAAPDIYARTVGAPVSPEAERILAPLPSPADDGDGAWWRSAARAARQSGERARAARQSGERARAARLPLPSSPAMVARLALRPWRVRPGVLLAGTLPPGRIDVSPIAADADALVARLEAEISELWVVAVRLTDGRRVVFGRPGPEQPSRAGNGPERPSRAGNGPERPSSAENGPERPSRAGNGPDTWSWGQAVAASCAVPGFFTPVTISGERFVDGGAHSPTNADLLRRRPLDLVVVSSPMSSVRTARHPSLDAPMRAACRLRLAAEVSRLRQQGIPTIVFQPTRSVLQAVGLNAMNPGVRVPVAEAAYAAARERCQGDNFLAVAAPLIAA